MSGSSSGAPAPLVLTRAQVRRVDAIATDRYGVPGIVLMENAAAGAARAIRVRFYPLWKAAAPPRILILCGGGNNGGDGLAVARHLVNTGAVVTVGLCVDPTRYAGDALTNWRVASAMGLPMFAADPPVLSALLVGTPAPGAHCQDRVPGLAPNLIIDAIFGTGLSAAPRDPFPRLVDAIEASGVPVTSIDLPSGLDADTGHPLGPRAVRATLTVTFVGLKAGFLSPASRAYTGEIEVVDIGCPAQAVAEAMRPTDPLR
ncbi:MAG: nnr 2 [Phycisphaerales bacterium]|nr:nnr 2 [Phycisphaerales bacterium]